MIPRLRYAMVAYAVLALLAALTLDGKLRIFILLLLAVLAFKSWIADKARRNESDTEPRP
jgi:chromate transport protein ChrA